MRRALCQGAFSLAVATVMLGGPEARAEGEGKATAESLFQRGKAAISAGDLASACPLFLESYRLDPAGGTLQNLAFCYEATGRYASAYARYEELRAISARATPPRTDRIQVATEHAAALEPKLSKLDVKLAGAGRHDVVVSVDGQEYREVAWSAGVVLDPGEHDVLVTEKGRKPWKTKVALRGPGASTLDVPVLAVEDAPPPPPLPPDPHPTRRAGLVIGTAGVVVAVAGGVFGVLAATGKPGACDRTSTSGPASSYDPAGHCYANTDAYRDWRRAYTQADAFANVSNVLVPVGLVAAGLGAYLVLRGPGSGKDARAGELRLAPGPLGASLSGTF